MTDREAREALDLQRELLSLRKENAELRMVAHGATLLLQIVERYQRCIKATGAAISEEEVAIVEAIKKGTEL